MRRAQISISAMPSSATVPNASPTSSSQPPVALKPTSALGQKTCHELTFRCRAPSLGDHRCFRR
jgi:hypothetical protein